MRKKLIKILPISVEDIDAAPVNLPVPAKFDYHNEYEKLMERFTPLSDENFKLKEDISKLRISNQTHELLNQLIEPSARKSFNFMACYSGGVGVLLVLSGFKIFGFSLSEQVLSFLVGSTAVTVIGLVGMVLTGVFVGARKN